MLKGQNMAKLFAILLAILCVLPQGCGGSRVPSNAKYDLNGGRYIVAIEDTDGFMSLNFHSSGEAKKVVDEKYDLAWGKDNRLVIENGKLQVNGKSLGELEPGGKIDIKKGPTIFVNGEKR